MRGLGRKDQQLGVGWKDGRELVGMEVTKT